jgi:hypothetical protein
VIIVYPLALVAVVAYALARRETAGGHGWRYFTLWAAAGALFAFSFVSGMSIGLLLLPAALLALFAAAHVAPHAEAAGAGAGLGAVLVLVAAVGHPGGSWAVAGVAVAVAAVALFVSLRAPTSAGGRRSRGRACA